MDNTLVVGKVYVKNTLNFLVTSLLNNSLCRIFSNIKFILKNNI
jgi:hypothetical protein